VSSYGLATPAAYFWVDPRKEVAAYMAQAKSDTGYYRKMFKSLVYQALVN